MSYNDCVYAVKTLGLSVDTNDTPSADITDRRFGGPSVGGDWSPAFDAALASGSILTAPTGGVFKISRNHKIDAGQILSCNGGGTGEKVTFLCTQSSAGISFGDQSNPTVATSAGESGGFCVDGANIASIPLVIGVGGYRTFRNVRATRGADTSALLYGTQNCTFLNFITDSGGNDGCRVDRAGSNLFINHEIYGCGRYGVGLISGGPAINQSGALTVAYPLNNVWIGGRSESHKVGSTSCIYQGAGINNMFSDFNCASSNGSALVKIEQAGAPVSVLLRFRDAQFFGSATMDAFNIGVGCSIQGTGTLTVSGVLNCFNIPAGLATFSDIDNLVLTTVANEYGGAGVPAYIRTRPRFNATLAGTIAAYGLVQNKIMPVYDVSGAFIGYLPIYN